MTGGNNQNQKASCSAMQDSTSLQPIHETDAKEEDGRDARNCVLGRDGQVTLIHADEGEGLESLISVAEAFEKSQQPDFNDIASPVIDGTDTEKHLVRTCVLCSQALLGRNAYGRHMKNAHPAVFGPYDCPSPGCGKQIESGTKMVTHMATHAIATTERMENR